MIGNHYVSDTLTAPVMYGSDGAGSCTSHELTAFQVTCGSGAWGTELQIHDGSVIGTSSQKFSVERLVFNAVGTANRLSYLQFATFTIDTGTAITTVTNATETFTKVDHGLIDNDRIILSNSGGGLPSGTNGYTVYYVTYVDDDNFTLSHTASNGDPVLLADDGTGTHSFHVATRDQFFGSYVSFAATNVDMIPIMVQTAKAAANIRISVRGKASGGTNTADFVFGVLTYSA